MSRILLGLIGLCFIVNASAQENKTPQGLTDAVASAISGGRSKSLATLISPETRADTKRLVVQDFMGYRRAKHFKIKLIAPDAKGWEGPPLSEMIKQHTARGYVFPAKPLGRIVISGQKPGSPRISKVGAFYGKFGENYLLIFAAPK
ncbi:MAG: hypothetical protein GC149_15680 [Gammaproteobacteria bacterium]|nr:hypothetical protein [Gammaproteobacteria bacterium]